MLLALLALTFALDHREPIQAPAKLVRLPDMDLRASDGPRGPFEDVYKFALLGSGRVAYTRMNVGSITICDADGKVLREVSSIRNVTKLVALGKSRVLLVGDITAGSDGKIYALWIAGVDLETCLPFAECTTGTVEDVVALPDLSCVAVVVEPGAAGADQSSLRYFDAYGGLRFSVDLPFTKSRRELCVASDGRIGVVEKDAPHRVLWYDVDGGSLGSIELDASDGVPNPFVTAVMPCANGGFFAQIFRVDPETHGYVPVLRRFDDQGGKISDFEARWIDGLPVRSWFFEGPDHMPWTFDEHAFLRIGFDGVATVQIGEPRDAGRLSKAWFVRTGPDGKIYAFASRDSALHVFDPHGVKLERIVPTEYLGRRGWMWRSHEEGRLPPAFDWLREGWLGPARDGLHFAESDEKPDGWQVRLIDARGEVDRVLPRPEGCDEQSQPYASDAADYGSITVVWRTIDVGSSRPVAACYDEHGALVRSFPLPFAARRVYAIAWDGKRIAAADELRVWVFDARGRVLADEWLSDGREYWDNFRTCGNAPDISWNLDFGNEGHELWLRRGASSTTFQRYALP